MRAAMMVVTYVTQHKTGWTGHPAVKLDITYNQIRTAPDVIWVIEYKILCQGKREMENNRDRVNCQQTHLLASNHHWTFSLCIVAHTIWKSWNAQVKFLPFQMSPE